MTILDTDVIIELFKGNPKTLSQLESIDKTRIVVSAVTVMELYRGVTNKVELRKINQMISKWPVVQIDTTISEAAINITEAYGLSHNSRVADALIAATALVTGYEPFTYNVKDFRYIPSLKLIKITD